MIREDSDFNPGTLGAYLMEVRVPLPSQLGRAERQLRQAAQGARVGRLHREPRAQARDERRLGRMGPRLQ